MALTKSQKAELRSLIKEYKIKELSKGFSVENISREYGFKIATVRNYWKAIEVEVHGIKV